jgi:ParB family chromosome partitioning protein
MKITEISIDKIIEPADQERQVISSEGLEDLAQSIKANGLISPVLVKKVGEHFEIVVGHRRLLACRMIRKLKVPCIIKDGVDDKDYIIKIHENMFREDVNAADEAAFFKKIIEHNDEDIDDIARMIGKSGAHVRSRLDLLKGDKEILEAVRDGQISPSIARELNLIPDEGIRQYYLRFAVDQGAKLRTVQEWRRNFIREKETEKVLQEGHTKEELPTLLPKYYYTCPSCKRPTEMDSIRAVSLCQDCYAVLVKSLEEQLQEKT